MSRDNASTYRNSLGGRLRFALIVSLLIGAVLGSAEQGVGQEADPEPFVVGSKKFTESVLLGEMVAHLARLNEVEAEHRAELGGTRLLWNALLSGDIDAYPDYTGTITHEILAGDSIADPADLPEILYRYGVAMTEPLGFNNTYAIGMREARAAALGIKRVSDLVAYAELKFGFSNEFMDRGDGWPALRDAYELPQRDVRGIDHDLAYRGLESGYIDVMDLYATDAEIAYYGLRVLDDDRRHFPAYNAVILYRSDLAIRLPEAAAAIRTLEGSISSDNMIRMNARAKLDRIPETRVAASFISDAFSPADEIVVQTASRARRIWQRTVEHLGLVSVSLLAAILLSIPLGIVAVRYHQLGKVILGAVGVIYTIPSLALLVFMIPLLGIGSLPAIVALFLYSLLPIVRNTHVGLTDIAPGLIESAEALGLPQNARLRLIDLPLASRAILAGIKTSAVINIGTATLGALIGAGGYGQPIITGIRLDDVGLILEGAVPAAALALVAQLLFDLADRAFIPKGLRLSPAA